MIFEIFLQNSLAFFIQNTAALCKILIITLVFKKKVKNFAENSDYNIDPCRQHYRQCDP
jgi:hypothetical protein